MKKQIEPKKDNERLKDIIDEHLDIHFTVHDIWLVNKYELPNIPHPGLFERHAKRMDRLSNLLTQALTVAGLAFKPLKPREADVGELEKMIMEKHVYINGLCDTDTYITVPYKKLAISIHSYIKGLGEK